MASDSFGRIQVEGLNETLRDLRKLKEKDIPKAIRNANLEAAELVVPTAQAEAPRRSGKLAKTVKAKATRKAGSVKAGSAAVPYAGPIHFGWGRRHIDPQPFLYRAIDKRIHEVRERYEAQMRRAIERFNS
jgi:HK97 gp10 family phage protein